MIRKLRQIWADHCVMEAIRQSYPAWLFRTPEVDGQKHLAKENASLRLRITELEMQLAARHAKTH